MARLLVVALICGGCFDPAPVAGSPCPTGVCPSGLVCSPASQTCERTAVDASVDAPIDAARLIDAAPGCYGVGLVVVCPTTPVTMALVLGDTVIDTDGPACLAYTGTSAGRLCLIAGTSVSVNGTLNAQGSRPLVLLATSSMTIAGSIDLASHRGGAIGAGAQPTACMLVNGTGDRGGPGGSLGGRGGNGGAGESAGQQVSAPKLASLTELRGGCEGGTAKSGGAGGQGGGAVYLIAVSTISINGTVNASGAGGGQGSDDTGGGGGGSGGMIGLDAPTIDVGITGRVLANGGGGGGSDAEATPGDDPLLPNIAARGGRAGDDGANGGDGSAGVILDGRVGQEGDDGGGGGGGGAGIIKVFPLRSIGPTVSPAPT